MKRNRDFECEFCGQEFVHESRYLKHSCKLMKRYDLLRTHRGQSSWYTYQTWMKMNKKWVKHVDQFMNSKYFDAFVRFYDFSKKTQVTSKIYIWVMVQNNIFPFYWTRDEAYNLYLEHMDTRVNPDKLVEITLETIISYTEAVGVEPDQIFNVLVPNEIIQLVRQRRLSPWLLLHSPKFHIFFKCGMSTEEQQILETIIRSDHWYSQFQNHPKTIQKVKQYILKLNL